MNRRELIQMATVAGLAGTAAANADDAPKPAHAMHDHAAMSSKYGALIRETTHCIDTGEACLTHCLMMLGEGNKELAGCAKSVRDLVAGCMALKQLAAANSPNTARMAAVVGQICTDCEAECRKHETKHEACRNCAQACESCAMECQKVAV